MFSSSGHKTCQILFSSIDEGSASCTGMPGGRGLAWKPSQGPRPGGPGVGGVQQGPLPPGATRKPETQEELAGKQKEMCI